MSGWPSTVSDTDSPKRPQPMLTRCTVVDFYNQINLLYGAITEFCSPQSCPEMKATDEYETRGPDALERLLMEG